MIYRGFNEIELKRITEILERNGVQYSVSVPEASMDYINDPTKRVDHRFMDSLLQIEIEKEEFDKINERDLSKLFDLRIYKEEESPFTEEELGEMESDKNPVITKDEHARMKQVASLLAIGVMTLLFLWKRGLF